MARRQLLTDEERAALIGIPADPDSLARLFTLSRADRALVGERRGDANRLGCAVQIALLRNPGTALAYLDQPTDALVTWMASHLDVPVTAFAEYARRPQTMTDHARQLATTLGLRSPTMADVPPMIEVATEAARGDCRPAVCSHHPARLGGDRAHRHRWPGAGPQTCRRCPGGRTTCSGSHLSTGWLALIGLIGLTLAEIIVGVWLTLRDPGRRFGATGLHLSGLAHAGWD